MKKLNIYIEYAPDIKRNKLRSVSLACTAFLVHKESPHKLPKDFSVASRVLE